MTSRRFSLAMLALAASLAPVVADPPDVPVVATGPGTPGALVPPVSSISTTASSHYPQVTCTTSDVMACDETLQMADATQDQLQALLQLGPTWRFPVNVHILTPDDPLTAKINREASATFAEGDSMRIQVVVPIDDPDRDAFVQYQFVTALLWEKFFATTKQFDTNTKLDSVPIWLAVGLREWLDDDPEHNRERIVRRAVQTKRAPTLDEVTSWKELSKDRLMNLWQRAFCYYLVDSLIKTPARRQDFQQWLSSYAGNSPQPAGELFPTERDWQLEIADATQRSRAIVYSWDETVAEMTSADVIAIPGKKDSDTQVTTIQAVLSLPRTPGLMTSLQKKIYELTELELRAHVSWRPIIALYRFALTDLAQDSHPQKAQQLLAQAQAMRAAEMDKHQKLVDYMNWFEVTKDYMGNSSRFNVFFSAAQQIDQAEADPVHTDPIRANLVHIESQL